MERPNKILYFGLILGLSLIIAAGVVGKTLLDVKNLDNVIAVSGSATQTVTSDSAHWTGSFTRTATEANLKDTYAQMKSDEKTVSDFLIGQGFAADSFEISPVFMNEAYKNNGDNKDTVKEYNLTQNVEIKSNEVAKIKELAKNSDQLAARGVMFSANAVEYYYTKLPDTRVALLPQAIQDAKKRAEVIATNSDRKIDAVKGVSMGVVQVMPAGTVSVDDYGSYDTSSINKDVMITVKTTFSLK
jgi:hypothetical protein